VIGYYPHSRFASDLEKLPWYKVITKPGFRLGRTDPALDPKGKLTVAALTAAAALYGDPAVSALDATSANVYPEQTLVGLLESGQLDAGFFYKSEALDAGIPTVGLGRIHLAATYTVTVLNNAPHRAGAVAFVQYLLSSRGLAVLRAQGLTVVRLRLSGAAGDLPSKLRPLLSS